MGFPPCQLCGSAPASCRSHIIPRQFYRRLRGEAKHLLELYVETDIDQRFTQSGIWEQGILCPKCDERLGVLDKYGYEVLPERIERGRIQHLGPGAAVVELGLIDVDRFKKFMVALVWRAARSTHEMFRRVKLGPYEKRFKDILTGKDSCWLSHVDCMFIRFTPPRYDRILWFPFPNRYDGVNVIQFYLYPWKLLIKLDKRPFSPPLQQTALRVGAPTYAMLMTDFSKGEVRMLADVQRKIKAHHAAKSGGKT